MYHLITICELFKNYKTIIYCNQLDSNKKKETLCSVNFKLWNECVI